MSYTEMMVYLAIFYLLIFLIIAVSTISYRLISGTAEQQNFHSMFHIGRPAVQFVVIFMIVSVIVMSSKYFRVRSFEQVIACEQPGNVYSLNIQVGMNEPVTVKNRECIHMVLTALEEETFLPSLKESSVFMRTPAAGREVSLEFLGMKEMDSITISSRGILYNNESGQAYELGDDTLYHLIMTMVDPADNL